MTLTYVTLPCNQYFIMFTYNIIFSHACIIFSHVHLSMLHVNIIMSHVDIEKFNYNIFMYYIDILYHVGTNVSSLPYIMLT